MAILMIAAVALIVVVIALVIMSMGVAGVRHRI